MLFCFGLALLLYIASCAFVIFLFCFCVNLLAFVIYICIVLLYKIHAGFPCTFVICLVEYPRPVSRLISSDIQTECCKLSTLWDYLFLPFSPRPPVTQFDVSVALLCDSATVCPPLNLIISNSQCIYHICMSPYSDFIADSDVTNF